MKERRNFYVYILIDVFGDVRYVGEGTGGRINKVSGRSSEYKNLVLNGAETLLLYENLSKKEAREKEQQTIEKLYSTGKLINRRILNNSIVNDLTYDVAFEYFKISDKSPSGLTWKKKISKVTVAGKQAGSKDVSGYYRVQLFGKKYSVHRIIWVLKYKQDIGETYVVNHIDSNPSNNSILNLERISQQENSSKKKKCSNRKQTNFHPMNKSEYTTRNISIVRNGRYLGYMVSIVYKYNRIRKFFSFNKYGESSLSSAIAWRDFKINELYGEINNEYK